MTDRYIPDDQPVDEWDDERAAAMFDAQGPNDPSLADLRADLAHAPHLNPELDPDGADAIPEWAWDRLSAAITAEATARAVQSHENVVAFPPAAVSGPADRSSSPSRARRWGGGLIAASVAVVAVGVGVGVVRTAGVQSAVVAGNAPIAASAAAMSAAAPQPFAAVPAESAEPADALVAGAGPAPAPSVETEFSPEAAPPATTPNFKSGANVVQAARVITKSGTDYQHEQLPNQVRDLLDNTGMHTMNEAQNMPLQPTLPATDGFTRTWQTLRDCITSLTRLPDSQALVVDRGSYEGDPAGVVVAPADLASADPSTPAPTTTIPTNAGMVDVWVVTPDCKGQDDKLDDLAPFPVP